MFKNFKHEKIETNAGWLLVLTMLAAHAFDPRLIWDSPARDVI